MHTLAFDGERDRPQLVRDRGRKAPDDLGVELVAREVDGRQSELRGQRHRDVATGQDLHLDEDLAEAPTGSDLRGERGVPLLLGDEFLRDEHIAEGDAQGRAATGSDAVTPESLEERRAELIERLATRPIETQPPDFLVRPQPSLPGSASHRPWTSRDAARDEAGPWTVASSHPHISVRPNGRSAHSSSGS